MEQQLAKICRRLRPLPGARHLVRALQKRYAQRSRGPDARWVTIDDYDGDLKLTITRGSHNGGTIFWNGFHARNEVAALSRLLRPNSVFVDAGAHLGEFTLFAAKRLTQGRVLALEPMEPVFRLLEHNVKQNGLHNVQLGRMALLDRAGALKLYGGFEPPEGAFDDDTVATSFKGYGRTLEIGEAPAITLDEAVKTFELPRVDVIKMDIEGAEILALRGAEQTLKRWRPALILEVSEVLLEQAQSESKELETLLGPLGYSFYQISDFSWAQSLRRRQRFGALAEVRLSRLPKFCNLACIAR